MLPQSVEKTESRMRAGRHAWLHSKLVRAQGKSYATSTASSVSISMTETNTGQEPRLLSSRDSIGPHHPSELSWRGPVYSRLELDQS